MSRKKQRCFQKRKGGGGRGISLLSEGTFALQEKTAFDKMSWLIISQKQEEKQNTTRRWNVFGVKGQE
jgi:hypothetical protein